MALSFVWTKKIFQFQSITSLKLIRTKNYGNNYCKILVIQLM